MFSPARAIEYRVERTFELALSAAKALSDGQLRNPGGSSSPPIGWHLWHMARWSDRIRTRLTKGEEIWREKGLAVRWGWDPSALGSGESGMEMEEKDALALPIPRKDQLIEYVEGCFEGLNKAMTSMSDDDLNVSVRDFYGRDVELALRGTAGLKGTATV